jgi:hypothetical protein
MITKNEEKYTADADQCQRMVNTPGGLIHVSIDMIKRIGSN